MGTGRAGAGSSWYSSANEALALAKSLLEHGEIEEAEGLYATLRSNPLESIRIEAAFQLANIRLRQGQMRQAISLFHEILNQRPNLVRVRLELARAYFLDKNYEDAAFQFELVKGGELPPEVLANVDAFLDAIRRQKNWSFSFAFSPVSDSNLNQASGGREECIDTIFGTLCRPLEEEVSGIGLNANASTDYFWRFHQDWGLRGTVGFNGTAYEDNAYNDFAFQAAIGPRYLWDSGEASLQGVLRKRWLGDREYNESYGFRLDGRQIWGRLLLGGGTAFSSVSHADPAVAAYMDGQNWSVYLQPRYILTDRAFIQAGLDFMRDDTRDRAYASNNFGLALGAYHAFPYGLSLFLEGRLTLTDYQDPQWYISRDNRIAETIRRDRTWNLAADFSSNFFEKYGLTPILRYSYTRRDSNIWTREYERHRINLLFNYRF